jgi:hypothetical protein
MNLPGTYQQQGAYLTGPDLTLIIGTRRKPTPHKPKHYLLAKGKGSPGARDLWISSIYPTPDHPNRYTFDFQGIAYILTTDAAEPFATIAVSSRKKECCG